MISSFPRVGLFVPIPTFPEKELVPPQLLVPSFWYCVICPHRLNFLNVLSVLMPTRHNPVLNVADPITPSLVSLDEFVSRSALLTSSCRRGAFVPMPTLPFKTTWAIGPQPMSRPIVTRLVAPPS